MSLENDDIGVRRAAKRKLQHELGIKCCDLDEMHVGSLYHQSMSFRKLVMLDEVFLA